jgi:ElaB/YqjD/DUF883 family membrane-anchored ribosome-binding protein
MSKSRNAAPSGDDLAKYARSLLHATSHITDHKVAETRDNLNDIFEVIGEGVEDVEEAALKKATQAGNYMRENPYKTIGIALGICALIGLVMAARKNNRICLIL